MDTFWLSRAGNTLTKVKAATSSTPKSCFAFFGVVLLGLSACTGWAEPGSTLRLPGERISILEAKRELEADPSLVNQEIILPDVVAAKNWPQAGFNSNHVPPRMAGRLKGTILFSVNLGVGVLDGLPIDYTPVVADGVVYGYDTLFRLTAADAKTGNIKWTLNLPISDDDQDVYRGGPAYHEGQLYVALGDGSVISVNTQRGEVSWVTDLNDSLRTAPSVFGSTLAVVSLSGRVSMLDTRTGRVLWVRSGAPNDTGIIGGAEPAIDGNLVVGALNSAQIMAMRRTDGELAWLDFLASSRESSLTTNLSTVRARPVLDGNRLYALSNSGLMVAYDVATGFRIWEAPVGGIEMPLLVGDYLFVVETDGTLLCLQAEDGRVRWRADLPQWSSPETQDGRYSWFGPVLVGDSLVLVNQEGTVQLRSAYTGKLTGGWELEEDIRSAPVYVDGILYLVTQGGNLIAWN